MAPTTSTTRSATRATDEQLSQHFWLSEFTQSQTAQRRGIDNTPSFEVVQNLRRLAAALQQVRNLVGAPIVISSGFRGARLNSAVGGSPTSLHMLGCAADFTAPGFGTPLQVAKLIEANDSIDFLELIYEGTWVHFGIQPDPAARRPRRVTTAVFRGNGQRTLYVPGLKDL